MQGKNTVMRDTSLLESEAHQLFSLSLGSAFYSEYDGVSKA